MANAHLTYEQVIEIKTRLWEGESQSIIAKDYKISSSLIGNIRAGHRWGVVQWPNGSTGGLPVGRKAKVALARKKAKREMTVRVKELLA